MSEKTENLNIVTWEIHETHPELVEPLRESLSKVIDPEIGMNVLQLGLSTDPLWNDVCLVPF